MNKTQLHINRDPQGRFYCPTCGRELAWDSSESQADRGMVPDDDTSSINYYHCQYCGASIEQFEANDEEKPIFPFWNDKLKDQFEDIY